VPLEIPDEPDAEGIKTVDIPLDGPVQIIDSADVPVTAADSKPANEPVIANPVDLPAVLSDSDPARAAGEFAVVIGAANDAEAQVILKGLKQNKLPAVIQSNGARFRIRIGPYSSRELAEQARLRSTAVITGGTVVAMDAVPPAESPADTGVPAAKSNVAAAVAATPSSTPKPPTAAVNPDAAKPAAVTAGKGYAVQVGAPANEQAAIALRDKMRAAGFNSFIQPVTTESGVRYRVRVGPENSREAAKLLLTSVKQKSGIDGIVVTHP
jgi:cell division septation protein DedD